MCEASPHTKSFPRSTVRNASGRAPACAVPCCARAIAGATLAAVNRFKAENLDWLVEFVEKRGGGLIMRAKQVHQRSDLFETSGVLRVLRQPFLECGIDFCPAQVCSEFANRRFEHLAIDG